MQVVPFGPEPSPTEWQAQAAQLTAAACTAAHSTAASAGLQLCALNTLCVRGCVQLLLSFTAVQLPGEEEGEEEQDTGTAGGGTGSAAAGVAGPTAGLQAQQVLQQLQAELGQMEEQVLVQVSCVHCSC
jgi:hypothetical protein